VDDVVALPHGNSRWEEFGRICTDVRLGFTTSARMVVSDEMQQTQ